jgi:hypothetical protein
VKAVLDLLRSGWTLGSLALAAAGCTSPVDPPVAPGGGQEFELSYETFALSVAPVLVDYGCHAAECHGGGIRGTFELSPLEAPDPGFDFEQASLQVDPYDPARSPLLLKPLATAAGGDRHSWEPFTSVEDEGYRNILAWIESGEF